MQCGGPTRTRRSSRGRSGGLAAKSSARARALSQEGLPAEQEDQGSVYTIVTSGPMRGATVGFAHSLVGSRSM